jgi:hypothetical protein
MIANQGFEVAYRFEGRLADSGTLDGSDHETSTQAGRRLLALHAHAFLTGRVPKAAASERAGYHIQHVASRQGSHIDFWRVVVTDPNPWLVAAACILGGAYQQRIQTCIDAMASAFAQSIRAVVSTAFDDVPHLPTTNLTLTRADGNRMPMLDPDAEGEQERYRLYELALRVITELARPVGRSADRLTVIVDGSNVAVIDEMTRRRITAERQRLLDREISDALMVLRTHWQGRH